MLRSDPDFPLIEVLMGGIGLVAYTCSTTDGDPPGYFAGWGFSGCCYFPHTVNPLRNPEHAKAFAACAAKRMTEYEWFRVAEKLHKE